MKNIFDYINEMRKEIEFDHWHEDDEIIKQTLIGQLDDIEECAKLAKQKTREIENALDKLREVMDV